jgi:CRISPR-associated protein Csb2
VWKRKLPPKQYDGAVESVLSELAKSPPAFHLPPATLGHTRHYMPLNSTDESKRTKVFDAFVAVAHDADVVLHWSNAELSNDGRQTLALLLSQLGYFGRAESWCAARLLPDFDVARINCRHGSAPGMESVRVLTAHPETWYGWDFKDKKIVPPLPKWNLLAETADLHLERWSDPPGSKWVTYARAADSFAQRPSPRPKPAGEAKTDFVVARFVLDVAEGRRPLPQVTQTLPLAEEVRRQLGREYARLIRSQNPAVEIPLGDTRLFSPMFYGKDEDGKPAKSHDHAFFLATDEDGDGRIDHVTIYAPGRFSRYDVSALDRLRSLSFGKEGEVEADDSRRRTTYRLLLVGLSNEIDRRIHIFGESAQWRSLTPFLGPSHVGRRGQSRYLRKSLRREWRRRSALVKEWNGIELLNVSEASDWRPRPLEFRRARSKRGESYRPCRAYQLEFSRPISGPLALGYASHFGLGLFAAVAE